MATREIRNVHILITGATDVMLAAFSILASILVARALGPAGRGEYAVVLLWPSVLAAVGSLGIRDATVYAQATGAYARSQVAGTALIIALVQAAVLMLAGAALIPVLTAAQSDAVTRACLFYLLFIPANLITEYMLGSIQGALDAAVYNGVRLLMGILYMAGVLALWALDRMTVNSLTIWLVLANYGTMLAALIAVIARQNLTLRMNAALTRQMFSYGLRVQVGGISNQLNQRADQMLMAIFLAPQQLGWYAIAVSVANLPRMVASAFATFTMPGVAGSGGAPAESLIRRHSRTNVTALGLACAALAVVTPVLIPLVYGRSFAPSVPSAVILIAATFFFGVGQVWAAALRGFGHPAAVSAAELISLAVTAVGLLLLLRPLGIVGAALTSLAAYATATGYLYYALHRRSGLRLAELVRPISAGSLLAALRR